MEMSEMEEGLFADESDDIPVDYEIVDDDAGDSLSEGEDITLTDSDLEDARSVHEESKMSWPEQVNMIHLRRYIDQLAEKVEENNLHVQKTREELKKCRDHIEELRRDREIVITDVEENQATNNTAAVYRLQANHDRICQELDGEVQLEDQIAETLDKAEYDLAQAQVEQGKMLLAEDSLRQREEKRQREHTEQAESRSKKEQEYADQALKQRRSLQRAEQSAIHDQQQRYKHQVEEAIRSQDKANKYLKKTLSKIRQRESEEEARQKEHLERRMQTMLKLKKDITNNRENLRALQARDKARDKQRQSIEEIQRHSIEAEGGNPSEILTKQKKLEEFQKEKELFKYQQRERQIDIAQKILQEEERMKQRKHQQPYLFPDPKREKNKMIKPHRRRKVMLLEGVEKTPGLMENYQIDMTKYEDVEDSDDDDAFSPTAMTKDPTKVPDRTSEESHGTLAKPEFEGMWDKHRPYKAPKDMDSELKLPGASKMEKDIMKETLEKHREGIIVKQVAAGKEFHGQPFYSKPNIIHFKDFEVGKTYKKKVTLTNVSYSVNYCKLTGLTEHLKDFIGLLFDPPGQMSAGLTCDLHVTFKPRINEDLEGTVQFLAQTGPFVIPLICTTKKCDLQVDKSQIEFGTSVIGETLKRTITLSNSGALGTCFEFCKVTGIKMRTTNSAETSITRMTMVDSNLDGVSPDSDDHEKDVTTKNKPEVTSTEKPVDGSSGEDGEMTADSGENAIQNGLMETELTDPSQALPEIMEELYALDGMKVGSVRGGEIGPFSAIKLEIIWQPTLSGRVDTDFSITFDDSNSEKIGLTALANAVDVPVWVERQNVDLKICMFDRLYQDTIVVNNRATTALRLKFEVCKELRNHLELLPKTGYIQAQSQFSAQLKFLPRSSLFEEAREYFDKETGVLEAPMIITVADQTRPVPFTVHAVVTNSDMEFDVSDIDFGHCTIHEAATKTVTLTNNSILPQQFGFLGIPEYVDVQPNDGFGTLLPMESIKLDIIFKPSKAKNFVFELNCKSLINREFKISCRGIGVHPPLELSHQVIHFRATAVDDVTNASIHIMNNHTSTNEFTHPVPRIGKGDIAPVGPTSFEFVVPEGAPISISPSVGTVQPGKKCHAQIRFSPHLDNADVCREAVRMITRSRELQALEEYQAALDREKELQEQQNMPKGGKKGAAPAAAKGKASPKIKGKGESQVLLTTKGPAPIETQSEDKIQTDSSEYAAAQTSLVRGFNGHFQSFVIPCYVASGTCSNPGELPYCLYNTLYLEVHCPMVRPELVVLSDNGRTTTDFGDISIGQSVVKSITVQNISDRTMELSSSCLDPEGPFNMLNALRVLPPDGSHTVLMCFTPHKGEKFQEVQEIICPLSTLHLTLKGRGVSPMVNLSVKEGVFDMGNVISGEYREETFKIVNTSTLSVQYCIKLDSQSLLRHAKSQGIPNFIKRHSKTKSLVGTQNNNGQQVFDSVPAEGVIDAGGTKEIIVTFAPDHPSDHYSDGVRIELFGQEEQHVFQVAGKSKSHIMYIGGGEPLTPEVESLAVMPIEEIEEDAKPPPIPVLVTLHSVAKETEFLVATKDIHVGCVRTMAVSQKKNGEWSFDNLTQINALGFNIDPPKGMMDAGTKRPLTITWMPPAGYDTNQAMEASILCTVKGDVTEQYRILLRGIVTSE